MVARRLRITAWLLDLVLLNLIQGAGSFAGAFIAAAVVSSQGLTPAQVDDASSSGALIGIFFWNLIGVLVNFGFLQGTTGSSVGKMIVGIRVVDAKNRPLGMWKSLTRTAAYTLSTLPLWAGYWMALINPSRRALHDFIVGSRVVPVVGARARAAKVSVPRRKRAA